MNLNDQSGRMFPPGGGHFMGGPPPHGRFPPPSFNTAVPPPGFMPPNQPPHNFLGGGHPPPMHGGDPPNLPPRLQLQMLLQIPLSGQQQPPQPQQQLPSLLDTQPGPYHPPFQQPPMQPPNFLSHPPSHFPPHQHPFPGDAFQPPGFPSLLSGGGGMGGGSSIPGLGDTQDLERLRALESALKEASRGSWQPAGVAPPPITPVVDSNEAVVARQAEAFIRELQARGQMFDYKHGSEESKRRRRRSLSSSSGSDDQGNDYFGRKKRNRNDEGSDLEEGEVQDEAPDNRFGGDSHQNLPPPLFGANMPSSSSDYYSSQQQHHDSYSSQQYGHIAPLLPEDSSARSGGLVSDGMPLSSKRDRERDRGHNVRRNKNYHDLDAEQSLDSDSVSKNTSAPTQTGAEAGGKSSSGKTGKTSFDSLFSAYLSAKASKDDATPTRPVTAQSPTHVSSGVGDIAPLLKTLGPSLQQALSAVGIQVPTSMGSAPGGFVAQSGTVTTTPSLSYALSAFDRDIAQLGHGAGSARPWEGSAAVAHEEAVSQSIPGASIGLPQNVSVEVAGESSGWAATAAEIASQIDQPGDQIYNPNLPREIAPGKDNRAAVVAVQRMIPLIPMVERENVATRTMEGTDYSSTPLLLPAKIITERVFPPLKDTSSAGRMKESLRRRGMPPPQDKGAAPGWSKPDLHSKIRQARERVNHLKIEQTMVEERLMVMSDELRKLHRYFETNYGVKLVRPVDLEDPPELVALWKRREEDGRKLAATEAEAAAAAAIAHGPDTMYHENSNEQPDENGPQESASFAMEEEGEAGDGAASEGGLIDSTIGLLKDRKEMNRRVRENKRRVGRDAHFASKPRANMRPRVDVQRPQNQNRQRGNNAGFGNMPSQGRGFPARGGGGGMGGRRY